MPIWLLKLIAEFAIKYLIGAIGNSAAAAHVAEIFSKYTPLPPDSNPSPASLRNPPRYRG